MLAFAKCVADATNQKRPKTLQRLVSAASSAGGDDEDGSDDPPRPPTRPQRPRCAVCVALSRQHIYATVMMAMGDGCFVTSTIGNDAIALEIIIYTNIMVVSR